MLTLEAGSSRTISDPVLDEVCRGWCHPKSHWSSFGQGHWFLALPAGSLFFSLSPGQPGAAHLYLLGDGSKLQACGPETIKGTSAWPFTAVLTDTPSHFWGVTARHSCAICESITVDLPRNASSSGSAVILRLFRWFTCQLLGDPKKQVSDKQRSFLPRQSEAR